MSDLYVKNLVSGTDFVISSWFRHQIKQRSSLGDFLDQVHTICHSTVYLPSYRLLAPLIIVVFYCNRFVTRFRVIAPTRVRDYVEQYKIYSNKVAQLRKVARKRFYEDRIRYTNDTHPKSGGTTSKCYLVFHSSQQSLASVLVNGSTILDKQLADVILDLDQVRHSMGQRGRKSGKPSEWLQGETDLAHSRCFKYLGLAGNNINRIDVIFNGFSKKTKQPSSNKLWRVTHQKKVGKVGALAG